MYFAFFLLIGLSLVAQAAGDKPFLARSASKFWLRILSTLTLLIAISAFWFGVTIEAPWAPATNQSFYVFIGLCVLALYIYGKRQLSEDK